MRVRLLVIVLSLFVAASACKQGKKEEQGQKGSEKQEKEQTKKKQKAEEEQFTFKGPDNMFEVTFPGEPDKSKEPVNVSGVDVKKHTISYAPSPLKNYTLVYMDFPKDQFKGKDPMKVLRGQKGGVISNLGGRSVEEKKLNTDYPGLMFKAQTGNLYGIYHLYLYKDRLYQLNIINKGSFAKDSSFLESFDLHMN